MCRGLIILDIERVWEWGWFRLIVSWKGSVKGGEGVLWVKCNG